MGDRRRGRSWPYPRRILQPDAVPEETWERLLAFAALERRSSDGNNIVAKLKMLMANVAVTVDGRLVSESRPAPAEIRDPLINVGVRGAEMLARYLVEIDQEAMERILVAGLDDAAQSEGVEVGYERAGRERWFIRFALTLEWLLPAMAAAGRAVDASVRRGRPAVDGQETSHLVFELATLWAEHAEADPTAFHGFVGVFFDLIGVPAPPRRRYAAAFASLRELAERSTAALEELRASHRRARHQLVAQCERWGQGQLLVRASAAQALRRATGARSRR